MAAVEATLHVSRERAPQARVHRDGRRADVGVRGGGGAFVLTGDPDVLRWWLQEALAALAWAGGEA